MSSPTTLRATPLPRGYRDIDDNSRASRVEKAPFRIEHWAEITFDLNEEFLIDGMIARHGVGLIYGASQTFKSFVAIHVAICVGTGRPWAGRRTEKAAVVYVAAEGAAGIRKRRVGYVISGRAPADAVDFALVSAAPNLGAEAGDYDRLVASIEGAGVTPGLVVVDTVAKAVGGADENGAGMAQFLLNAERLSQHFGCFVLAVHHVGHDTEKQNRPRGWSGLTGALDLQMLAERRPGEMTVTVTIQKLKDEPSGIAFAANLERVDLGVSNTGREVSTLVVDSLSEIGAQAKKAAKAPMVPQSKRLLRDILAGAIEEAGEEVRSFMDGPLVRAVDAELVRERYYARIAEKADADEDPNKLAGRQRRAFNRALQGMLDAKHAVAREIAERRMIWLP